MTKRGRYAKGVSRRQEILTVAVRLFAQNGYRGTSLREIARECGLSIAGLFHYFETKEDLFVAVLDKRDEIDAERAGRHDGLLDAMLDVVDRNVQVPGLVELYTTMAASAVDPAHPASGFFARHFDTTRAALGQAVVRAQERGEVAKTLDPQRLAVLLTAAMDGLQMQWTVDSGVDMGDYLRYLWEIIRAHPAPGGSPGWERTDPGEDGPGEDGPGECSGREQLPGRPGSDGQRVEKQRETTVETHRLS